MQYLTRWRMQLAAWRPADGDAKVSAVALDVGYATPRGFPAPVAGAHHPPIAIAASPPALPTRRNGRADACPPIERYF